MIEVGKRYYIIAHAYHHYVGEVMEVSPRFVKVINCVKVMSDNRGWEQVLFNGFNSQSNIQHVPDGTILPLGLPLHPWNHPIPNRLK